MKVSVVNTTGKKVSTVDLPKEMFEAKVNLKLMTQAMHVFLTRRHQQTKNAKTRGEVNLSTSKVWRQKGTGRARHGSRRAPIFVGGGVVHGPSPGGRNLKLSTKMRRKALFGALSQKASEKDITVVDGLGKIKPKTSEAVKALRAMLNHDSEDSVLVVLPERVENVMLAHRNVKGVATTQARLLNAYDVMRNKKLLLMKDSIAIMKQAFLGEKKVEKKTEKVEVKEKSK